MCVTLNNRKKQEYENQTQYQVAADYISESIEDLTKIGYLRSVAVDGFVETIFLSKEEAIDYIDDESTFENAAARKDEVDELYLNLPELKNTAIMNKMTQLYESYSTLYEVTTVEKVDFDTYIDTYNNQYNDFICTLEEMNRLLTEESK